MKGGQPTRRMFLRGAGVALALPWLDSLAPRAARGAATLGRNRFVAMSFPCGVGRFWKPSGVGAGAAWKISPILEPLQPFKSQVSVLSDVGNYSPFNGHAEPSHSKLSGAFLTCTAANGMSNLNNGISVDQVIARDLGPVTPIPSLQVGLSTIDSSTDGLPGAHSRSISWASATEPLFKLVDPQKVFDKLFGAKPPADTRAADKSVLDKVVAQAMSLEPRLGRSDRARLDQFLTSVREVEKNIATMAVPARCTMAARPTQAIAVGNVPADYDRDEHAETMIDLVALAFECDLTRVVSFMLDDSRSDYVYSFLTQRVFTDAGSTPGTGTCGGLHGLATSSDTNNAWLTIHHWFVQKLARLCQRLQAAQEGAAGTVLDQSLIWFGSEMNGLNHDGLDLPLLYVGSAGGRLKVDQHVSFNGRQRRFEDLANVYLTLLRNGFDLPETSFGKGLGEYVTAGRQIVPELVA